MRAQGHSMHQVELDEGNTIPPLTDFDVLLVMGGPMDVWEENKYPWLTDEKAAIREWVSRGRPYLGMCLGEQLLADAMGGAVAPMTAPPEVGMSVVHLTPNPIFAGVPELCTCFQWHGAEVTSLPPTATLLATSPGCAVQGFVIGRHAYGLQFHMELTETTASEWGALPEYAAALEAVKGPGAMDQLKADVGNHLGTLQATAHRVFSNFLAIAEDIVSVKAIE
ncbi:MAG: type 1 glutamine amidotransferase [Acidiphilium sp.]|nr:type 1 glutamine amidotransferase [Acidiphilium sp.]